MLICSICLTTDIVQIAHAGPDDIRDIWKVAAQIACGRIVNNGGVVYTDDFAGIANDQIENSV